MFSTDELNINTANSAGVVAEIAEASKLLKQQKILEETNSPTNENLRAIIKQNYVLLLQSEEKIKLLTEQNESLKKQLDAANQDSKRNRIRFYFTTLVAVASLIANIVIAIVK